MRLLTLETARERLSCVMIDVDRQFPSTRVLLPEKFISMAVVGFMEECLVGYRGWVEVFGD